MSSVYVSNFKHILNQLLVHIWKKSVNITVLIEMKKNNLYLMVYILNRLFCLIVRVELYQLIYDKVWSVGYRLCIGHMYRYRAYIFGFYNNIYTTHVSRKLFWLLSSYKLILVPKFYKFCKVSFLLLFWKTFLQFIHKFAE